MREAGQGTLLQVEDLHFAYRVGKRMVPIFRGLNLSVREQEFVCLLGPSGSGKSTLFKIITGIYSPMQGHLYYRGQPFTHRQGKVGYMPQQDLLLPWRTVLENAILPLEIRGISKAEAMQRAEPYLALFGLEGMGQRYPHQLSGGMRQRVSFLRAVLGEQELLLLDEPFGALDSMTRRQMQEWLLGVWQELGQTVLFITHDVEEALFLADRVGVLTSAPISRVQWLEVQLPRPRQLEVVTQPAFVELKRQLLEAIQQGGQGSGER